jgi:hypothetical protein
VYVAAESNRADDGIPLRADLHRALDAGLIRLGSGHRLIWGDAQLETQYGQYRAQREGTAR